MFLGHVLARVVRGLVVGMVRRWFTTLLALVLVGGGVLALASHGLVPGVPAGQLAWGGAGAASGPSDTREMIVEEVRPVRNGERIDLYLKEKNGNRRLVMAVGQSEALAIFADLNSSAQAARRIESPKTYDLMRSLVQELGGSVDRVVVNNVSETTFFAKVIMNGVNGPIEVVSRPSYAIALALRSKAPIYAEASVLDMAGVTAKAPPQ